MSARPTRRAWLAAALLAFPPCPECEPMNAPDPSACVNALRALVEGRLEAWHGLPAGCSTRDVEAAYGPGDGGPDGVGSLGGTPTAFRRHSRSPRVPHDVVAWFRDGAVLGVEVTDLKPTRPLAESLGEPEARERSGVGSVHTQLVYASRGLVLHVQNITGAIVRAQGFAACTLDEFRALPWGQSRVERRPLRTPR